MAAHRYWRLFLQSYVAGSAITAGEIEFRGVSGGPDLTGSGTAIASGGDSGYGAANAFNNIAQTAEAGPTGVYWGIAAGAAPQWIGYDFGAGNAVDVNEVYYYPSRDVNRQPQTFYLQYSDDNINWFVKGYARNQVAWVLGVPRVFNFTPVAVSSAAAHWMLAMVGKPVVGALVIGEIEFRATAGGADQANGGTAFASSEFGAGWEASRAFDNNNATGFSTTNRPAIPDFVRYAFTGPVVVNEVYLFPLATFSNRIPSDIAVLSSSDGGNVFVLNWEISGAVWAEGVGQAFARPATGPAVSTIAPTNGPTLGGTVVTISGAALTGATGALFGTEPATSFTVDSDVTITCVTPAHVAGLVAVTVQHPSGDIVKANAFTFTDVAFSDPVRVTQAPVLVMDLSPQRVRITQLPLLVLNLPRQPNRVTQLPVMALDTPQPIPLPRPVLPEVPVTEIWSWKTALTISEGGKEQRAALRQYPRYSMRINALILNEADRRDVFQLLFKFINREMLYPFYQYSAAIMAEAVAGATYLFFDPARTDLRAGETAALFDPYLTQTHYVTLGALDAGGAALASPLAFAVPAGWLICPAISFRVPASVGLNMRALDGSLTLAMESTRPRTFQRPGAAPTLAMLDGMPVLHNRPLSDDVAENFEQNINWLDNESSIPEVITNWRIPFVSGSRSFLLKRPDDMDYWRGIAGALRGRTKPFLMPTFRDDLPLAAVPALGASEIVTSNIQFFDFWREKTYRYIRIDTANGVVYRYILEALCNYTPDGTPVSVTLKLDTPLGVVAGSNIIRRVSFMNICRLDSDDITLTHNQLDTKLTLEIRTVNE